MDNSIDNVLASVMGNEALMNKIKDVVKSKNGDTNASLEEVISLIAPTLNDDKNEDTENTSSDTDNVKSDERTEKSDMSTNRHNSSSFISSFSHTISKNAGLLLALKPYLSKERCQMIDGVVKISQIANTLNLLWGG